MFTSRNPRPDSAFSNKENFFTDDSTSFYDDTDVDTDGEEMIANSVGLIRLLHWSSLILVFADCSFSLIFKSKNI